MKKCCCGAKKPSAKKIVVPELKYDANGLIPAIVQDFKTGEVLMMAYMNKESVGISLKESRTCFWSRSRKELWRKGDTSGHVQKIKKMFYDCDSDTILVQVEQIGGIACHTGNRSCFFTKF